MQAIFVSGHKVCLSIQPPFATKYDWTGHLSIHGLWSIITDAYFESENKGFMTGEISRHGYTLYKVRETTVYFPNLYRRKNFTSHGFLFKNFIGAFGTTSIDLYHQLVDPVTQEVLVHVNNKSVIINQNTRRPCHVPKTLVDKYAAYTKSTRFKLGRQIVFVPPVDAFRFTVRTRYSDLDYNNHLHFSEYYRMCGDCASEASRSGFYRHFLDDLSLFQILETDVTFLRESGPCAELQIFTWQDPVNVQKIFFTINFNENLLYQALYIYDKQKLCDGKSRL